MMAIDFSAVVRKQAENPKEALDEIGERARKAELEINLSFRVNTRDDCVDDSVIEWPGRPPALRRRKV